jgi:hypothetical protein
MTPLIENFQVKFGSFFVWMFAHGGVILSSCPELERKKGQWNEKKQSIPSLILGKQWSPLRDSSATLSAAPASPPRPPSLTGRTIIHPVNFELFLLSTHAPPPLTPAFASPYPDVTFPLLIFIRVQYIATLAAP